MTEMLKDHSVTSYNLFLVVSSSRDCQFPGTSAPAPAASLIAAPLSLLSDDPSAAAAAAAFPHIYSPAPASMHMRVGETCWKKAGALGVSVLWWCGSREQRIGVHAASNKKKTTMKRKSEGKEAGTD